MAVLHLEIDSDELDVNVHPQKVEVRFSDPRRVFAAVRRAVHDGLASSPWLGQEPPGGRAYRIQATGAGYEEHRARIEQATRRFWSAGEIAGEAANACSGEEAGFFGRLRFLGQVLGAFLVCEGEDELILLDQHAAHERVTFERLRGALRDKGRVPAQKLLLPASVELDLVLDAVARERGEALSLIGFDVEPFGGRAWTIRAIPAWIGDADPAALFREVLERLESIGEAAGLGEAGDELLARIACHQSVRAGQPLDERQVRPLLAEMDRVDWATHCPHGRPVMIRLPRAELERRLSRR